MLNEANEKRIDLLAIAVKTHANNPHRKAHALDAISKLTEESVLVVWDVLPSEFKTYVGIEKLKLHAQAAHNNYLAIKDQFINRKCKERVFQKAHLVAEEAKQAYRNALGDKGFAS